MRPQEAGVPFTVEEMDRWEAQVAKYYGKRSLDEAVGGDALVAKKKEAKEPRQASFDMRKASTAH